MIDYRKFELSLKRSAEQYENHQYVRPERSDLDREGIAESVIPAFRNLLRLPVDRSEEVSDRGAGRRGGTNSPKPVFRLAHENHLFESAWSNG